MHSYRARIVGLLVVASAVAGCQPARDVRPPYHEPAAAKPASQAGVATPRPASQPVR